MNANDILTATAIATADLAVIALHGSKYVSVETMHEVDALFQKITTLNAEFDALDIDDITDEQDEQMLGYRAVANRSYQTLAETARRLHA